MTYFDVFNGDADGICALQQLRLEQPRESRLVTGVKREIDLLRRVEAGAGDEVTVLDVSLDTNRADLVRLLEAGAQVLYFDHHMAGEIPDHPGLRAVIDLAPDTCTSLLVDAYLEGRHRRWAVAGAFGDNFFERARQTASGLGLSESELQLLCDLGTYLNYNGYGMELEDLFFPPDALFRRLQPYRDPLDFVREDPAYQELRAGYLEDMAKAAGTAPETATDRYAVFILPDAPWARRVSGVFSNDLARKHPERAHALLTVLPEGGFRVSVRAPQKTKTGAAALCKAFPTGGGREAAAGINLLPEERLGEFVERMRQQYG